MLCKIKSIKKIKNYSKRYDIQVAKNNNFFANGILVHNCSIYSDYFHARSIDGRHHPSRNWVKQFAAQLAGDIPPEWRVCGENLYAQHSIPYSDLKSYFYGFSMWDEKNTCLSWDDTRVWFNLLTITPVEVIFDDIYDESRIRKLWTKELNGQHEGYVVRIADSFPYGDFRKCVGKFVKKGFSARIKHHWQSQAVVKNILLRNSND